MADERKPLEAGKRTSGALGAAATLIGAITAGKREHDKLIRTIASAGLAGVLCVLILRAWNEDRAADRTQRHQEHIEMVQLMRDQHNEDISERRHMACINAAMTDTVRAAIWRERPQPREACIQPQRTTP